MRSNVTAVNTQRTHEGGPARIPKSNEQLARQVATCMLFEDTFYESGNDIAASIAATCAQVEPSLIAEVAIQARGPWKLRHVPLFLLAQLDLRRADCSPGLLRSTIEKVVQRPDEMGELMSIIQKVNKDKELKKCLSAQVKKGIASVFKKFSAYQLSKWNRDNEIKLRDVLFLSHSKPKNREQAKIWKQLIDNALPAPDTWEVALSAGKDKKKTWTRLLKEEQLGYMALLMNLRNMTEAGVDQKIVEAALMKGALGSRALPFRFISAAKAAPGYAQTLSDAMVAALGDATKLPGMTYVVVDVSGSMDEALSGKSQLTRIEAASALAILLREVCESARVFTFSNHIVEVPNLRGVALSKSIYDSQSHQGTYLGGAMKKLATEVTAPDRLIVITDEQSHDGGVSNLSAPVKGYLINVAPYKPGLEISGGWVRISGFSERIVDFVRFEEGVPDAPPSIGVERKMKSVAKLIKKVGTAVKKLTAATKRATAATKKVVKKPARKVAKKAVKKAKGRK